MQHFAFQQSAFVGRDEMWSSVSVVPISDRKDSVVCPKPRRPTPLNAAVDHPLRPLRWHLSHQAELYDSKSSSDLLDILLAKGGCGVEQSGHGNQVASSPPPFFCGSPPSRVSNPLIQDARFKDEGASQSQSPLPPAVSSPARKASCVRGNFGNNPAVRVEGFDCLDRGSRNCSIPALA